MNHDVDLITDFDYPEEECDPHGMSGCGVRSIPDANKGELWSAQKSQLLGVLIGHHKSSHHYGSCALNARFTCWLPGSEKREALS